VAVSKPPRPRVDVGVVTWNTRDLTVSCLRRLVDSDQGCDVRVLVHDNGSSDGTAAAVRSDVPEADVEAGTENLGFAAAVNRLLARSDAPWFVTLNSDAWPEPGALGRLVATAETAPSAAAVAPRLERPDGELEHSTHPFPSARVAATYAFGLYRWMPDRRLDELALEGWWAHDRPRDVDWAVGAALLLRRAAIDDVGPLDERFFMYAEDLEWCWRARQRGWRIRFEPGSLVRHVGNASGKTGYGGRRTAAYLRNTYRFYGEAHGLGSTLAFRGFNALGASRQWLLDMARGRRDRAAWWADQVRVHLLPAGGTDGPPADP
jgi:N-acetylglucosaminyl-diphospho-decaprenol L-rhamnosyltransferase